MSMVSCSLCAWLSLFPGVSDSKESTCNAGDLSSIPWLGRPPGEGNGNPLQYSCLENPHGQRSLATVLRVTKSQTCMTHIHTFPLNNSLWKIFEAYYVGGFLYRGLISTSLKYTRVLPILEHFRLNFWGPPRKCEFYLSNTLRTSLWLQLKELHYYFFPNTLLCPTIFLIILNNPLMLGK